MPGPDVTPSSGDRGEPSTLFVTLAAMLRGALGDHDQAAAVAVEMRSAAEDMADDRQLAIAHLVLGMERLGQGDPAGAQSCFEDALVMARAAGNSELVAMCLVALSATVEERELPRAIGLLGESREIFVAAGDVRGVEYADQRLARLDVRAGTDDTEASGP
ncbi:MAG TPA: hypothetical protein VFE15_16555 [Marmoricola sp.]|nr:hypothetical protein [Marmoricola sp.]